jgi:hypothetical protein|tara:strand:+ start:2496 stop:3086 length:591 start_codon:yes stop_codon:yes gene_type:complete
MLLNPNARGETQILDKVSTDPFDMPVPGQSLTDEPRKWAWENPPQFSTVDDSLQHVIDKIEGSEKAQKGYDELITLGMPIESLVNTITFGGFVEGLWTVDIAEMLKPPLMSFFMLYADEKDLPFVPYNNEDKHDKTIVDNMDKNDIIATIKENNPVFFSEIKEAIDRDVSMKAEKLNKIEEVKNSFLVVTPENMEE